MEFKGIIPFLITPVNERGNINEKVLREIVAFLISRGVHGINILGSTGEFAYLTPDQKKTVIEIVVDEVDSKVPVITGVGSTSTNEAIKEAKRAEELGTDGILAILPTYFPVSAEKTYEYYAEVAKAISCPVVLYNNPRFSKIDLTPDVINKLAEIPNIQYLKEASSNIGKLINIMNLSGDNIKIFSSSAQIPVFVLMMGGVGWMSGPSCIIPDLCIELYRLVVQGKWKKAIEVQKKIWKVNIVFQKYSLAACIKYGLEYMGFKVGEPVHPQTVLDKTAKKEIRDIIDELKKQRRSNSCERETP